MLRVDGFRRKRKTRGNSRYFRRMAKTAHTLQVGGDGWANYWHVHLDVEGRGNLGGKHRRANVQAHVTLFLRLDEANVARSEEAQVWLHIDDSDAGQNAVFRHTPNPYSQFPATFPGFTWGDNFPDVLARFIRTQDFEVGKYDEDGVQRFLVRRRARSTNGK